MTHLLIPLKIEQKSKTDIPSSAGWRIWNRRFCFKHNDSISSDAFVANGRWNIMFAPVVIFFTIAIGIGCEARIAGGLSMTIDKPPQRTEREYGILYLYYFKRFFNSI
jgi:hypothetical protein